MTERRARRDFAETDDSGKRPASLGWLIAKVVVVVLAVRILVYSPFTIPSQSMMPTLLEGDFLLIAKWPYGYSKHALPFDTPLTERRIGTRLPARGDIVVFEHPDGTSDLVKRVIGLPGDRVAVRRGTVILNGKVSSRSPASFSSILGQTPITCLDGSASAAVTGKNPCNASAYREAVSEKRSYPVIDLGYGPGDDYGPVTVLPGHLFLMGDNRDNSLDSRFASAMGGVEQVPVTKLIGRADIVLFSVDGTAHWSDPASWFTSVRWNRIGHGLSPDD